MRKLSQVAAAACLLLPLAACGGSSQSAATTTHATTTATGGAQPTSSVALSSAPPPWLLPTDARPFIAAAGLQVQGAETLTVHYHTHVDIIDKGAAVPVPGGIGFVIQNGQATGITSLHTHDASGVVHIESQTNTPFTLGQVFTEWGVRLTTGQIGGLISGNGNALRVYVNGTRFAGDPATIVLEPHQEIALWFGSAKAAPRIPTSYGFPAGE